MSVSTALERIKTAERLRAADNRKTWVEALRSGEFKQATRMLYDGTEDAYCCLGVACELFRRETGQGEWLQSTLFRRETGQGEWLQPTSTEDGLVFSVADDSSLARMPSAVQKWTGIRSSSGLYHTTLGTDSLAGVNDSGASFDTIADIIEEEPSELVRL